MSQSHQIFISSKTLDPVTAAPTRDAELAKIVHEHLSQLGYSVFLSTLSLASLGIDAYKKAIDDALDHASVLIAVGTSRAHLDSKWVHYEWDSFVNDILSGIKPQGHVFVYAEGITSRELPRSLRQHQMFLHAEGSLLQLENFLRNAIGAPVPTRKDTSENRHAPASGRDPLLHRTEIAIVDTGCGFPDQLDLAVRTANECQSQLHFAYADDALAARVRLITGRSLQAVAFFDALEGVRGDPVAEYPFLHVMTDAPVSGKTMSNLFGSHRASRGLAVTTTAGVPATVVPQDKMHAYFLYYLARYALSFTFPQMQNHRETRQCVFDMKVVKTDLTCSMSGRAFCDECREEMITLGGVELASRVQAIDTMFATAGRQLREQTESPG